MDSDFKTQFASWRLESFYRQVDSYNNTEHCRNLVNIISQKRLELSNEERNNTLAYSAHYYFEVERDPKDVDGQQTFWDKLRPFIIENPYLFSIAEIAKYHCAVKFLIFVKPKWAAMAKTIIDNYGIEYELTDVVGGNRELSVFSFFQGYRSYSEWEGEKENKNSIAQRIQKAIQVENGIKADLFSLRFNIDCTDSTFGMEFAILSPGSKLDIFAGRDRESESFFREDLQQMFRSSWEANIARILNYKGILWEYEKETVALNNSMYIPDFFLQGNTILEVKGFWDEESRKKVIQFSQQYPKVEFKLIDTDMYESLERVYGQIIPNWEFSQHTKNHFETIPIVGIKYCASKQAMQSASVGAEIKFIREPNNKYDKNAIMATIGHEPLGHISSDWAFIYAAKMDIGMTYTAKIVNVEKSAIRVRIQRDNPNTIILYDIFT